LEQDSKYRMINASLFERRGHEDLWIEARLAPPLRYGARGRRTWRKFHNDHKEPQSTQSFFKRRRRPKKNSTCIKVGRIKNTSSRRLHLMPL